MVPAESGIPVLTVSELTAAIRQTLEEFGPVWVSGEISNCKRAASGHVYFSLKDEDAVLECAVWRPMLAKLKVAPENGLEVVAFGVLDVYPPRGAYKLIVHALERRGEGAQQRRIEELKKRLAAEGLFDEARKRPLPMVPRAVGVVTSLAGAARHDIVDTILKRFPRMRIVLRDARVQGERAAEDLAEAIRELPEAVPELDVLLVGRGGGSSDDLMAFNEECVVRAIAACPVPVISAVGHEVDWTLADHVADRRAKTPTEAAVLAVPVLDDLLGALRDFSGRAQSRIRKCLDEAYMKLARYEDSYAMRSIERMPAERRERLGELERRLAEALAARAREARERLAALASSPALAEPGRRVELARSQLESLARLAAAHLQSRLRQEVDRVEAAARQLSSLSPFAVLERGYSITWHEGKVVRRAGDVPSGAEIRTRLAEGELRSRVIPNNS